MRSLFWVVTEGHEEDWFIVADSDDEAEQLHEDFEGFGEGDAEADRVCDLPGGLQTTDKGWPTDELLVACGGRFLPRQTDGLETMRHLLGSGGRIVEIAGNVYAEGDLATVVATEEGRRNTQ